MSEQTATDKTSNDCQKTRVCWGATSGRWVSHSRRFEETRCLYFQCQAAQQQRASRPAISDVQVVVPPVAGSESCNCGSPHVVTSRCVTMHLRRWTRHDAVSVGNRHNNEWRYSSTRWTWQVSFTLGEDLRHAPKRMLDSESAGNRTTLLYRLSILLSRIHEVHRR